MMHRCSSSHGNMVGSSCSCSSGLYPSQSNSFSMLFSMPNHKSYDETDMYAFMSPSSVDCTLSLGTPSTRLSDDDEKRIRHDQRRSASNCMTDFCWDFLHTKNSPYNTAHKIIRPVAVAIIVVTPLVAAPAMIPSSPAVVLTVTPLLHRFGETVLEAQSHYAMLVEFGSRRKREEPQQQMQTAQTSRQQRSSHMAITTIHGFKFNKRSRKKCLVFLLQMSLGSLKTVIKLLIRAFPSFLGDSM
ncbi:hypothetical protein CISIN_1g026188mg [Citrus sinensis]|uniref:Uncharacterized protein n=1 Tax=Citrus sinensis TaxID=2711 RepID=A0A067GLK1_CITSI|nr:hypothetical protein CISIN_1g026188mg [Citrus sinensis]